MSLFYVLPSGEPCRCVYDPYDPADYSPGEEVEESWHYRRVCETCGAVTWSLHCPHDRYQRACPAGHRPAVLT